MGEGRWSRLNVGVRGDKVVDCRLGFHGVGRGSEAVVKGLVCEVSHGFCDSTKPWRGFSPTHRQTQGEGNEWGKAWERGKDHSQAARATGREADAVEAVSKVNLV